MKRLTYPMYDDLLPSTVGELLQAQELSLEEVKRSAAAIFDGQNKLPVTRDVAINLPPFWSLSDEVREAILNALMAGRPVRR
jgi:hypothetical protein